MTPWVDVPRQADGPLHKRPLITLRRNGVAFNAVFVRTAKLTDFKFVSIKVDIDTYRLGFKFHNDDSDSYSVTLCHDGGGKGHTRRHRHNLMVQTNALMRLHKWVEATSLQREVSLRQFPPEWIGIDRMWVIALRPCFERFADHAANIPATAAGVYRYVHNDEIVYIGKGSIRERALEPSRESWKFDRIEYSIVEDSQRQYEVETWWLEHFERGHGRLPLHNRIGGRRS